MSRAPKPAKAHVVESCTKTGAGDYIVRLINPSGTARSGDPIEPGKRVTVSGGVARLATPETYGER